MVRDFYKEKKIGLSYQNEPPIKISIKQNIRLYPDMFNVYKSFQKIFNIEYDNFILSNGAENAIKNVLLAIKCKRLSWSKPSWGFIDVYCEQLNIKKKCHDFIDTGKCIIESKFKEKIDVYYNTMYVNNFIKHDINKDNLVKARISIIDISYLDFGSIHKLVNQYDYKESNIIYVGSFDKLFGCGLRLGFAIFPNSYKENILLQREIFINSAATNFIMKFQGYKNKALSNSYYFKRQIENFLAKNSYRFYISNNFISIFSDIKTDINVKKIRFGNTVITRFGMPINKYEYLKIIKALQKE